MSDTIVSAVDHGDKTNVPVLTIWRRDKPSEMERIELSQDQAIRLAADLTAILARGAE